MTLTPDIDLDDQHHPTNTERDKETPVSDTLAPPETSPAAAPAPAPAKPATAKTKQHDEDHGTLAGVLIPGGAATALILGCGILHTFGPAILIGGMALASIGTAGVRAWMSRSRRKTTTPRSVGKQARTQTASRHGGPASSKTGRAGGGSTGSRPGGATRTPGRPTATTRMTGPAKTAATAHRKPQTPTTAKPNNGPKTPNSPKASSGAPKAQRSGRPPLSLRKNGAASDRATKTSPGTKPGHASKPTAPGHRGHAGRLRTLAQRLTGRAPQATGPTAGPKTTKPTTTSSPRANRATTRAALRKTAGGIRSLSKPIARTADRVGQRVARLHKAAAAVRLRHVGPNWWPRLAKAFAAAIAPAVALGRRLMNRARFAAWIERYRPIRNIDVEGMLAGPAPTHVRPATVPAPHATIHSPAPKETRPMGHPVIAQAAENVQQAFAALASNPADNMREYEEALTALPELLAAVGEGLRSFSQVTGDEFAVESVVPDMLGDASSHAQQLATFITGIHEQYRAAHHDQIENYESPRPGAEKWDVRANQ